MANYLTNSLDPGATSLCEAVDNAINKNTTSDEERKELKNEITKAAIQHETEMANIGLQEDLGSFADIADARQNERRIQESEHASWLAKNINPILAIGILLLTFIMYGVIVYYSNSEKKIEDGMKDIVIYILGALTTVATQVVSYFFGSSSGSAVKSKALNDLAKRK